MWNNCLQGKSNEIYRQVIELIINDFSKLSGYNTNIQKLIASYKLAAIGFKKQSWKRQ